MESLPNFVAREERVCDYLLPVRVVLTRGRVSDAERLLTRPRLLQIGLTEPETVRLENDGTGERAGILLDFGRELHGGVRILCHQAPGPAYPRLMLRFGESASEAVTPLQQKNAGNDHAAREMTVLTPMLSDQTWGQTGFRFVYLELMEERAAVTLKCVLAAFVYRDLPRRGRFCCSDPLLNRIFDTAADTCHLCLQTLLWDGVKRDRLVWVGDMHPEMLAIRWVFGDVDVMDSSLDAAREMTPLPGWMCGMPAYSLWWLLLLGDWYRASGRVSLLDRNRAYVLGLVRQVLPCVGADGSLTLPSYFLDWPTYGTPAARDGDAALAALALDAAAGMLSLWGETALEQEVVQAAMRLRARGGWLLTAKPAAALLALAGMADERAAAEALAAGGARGMSTFMSYYMLTALSRAGRTAEALALLRVYYGGMLRMGATTFWEDFSVDWMENSAPIDRLPRPGERDIHADFGAHCYQGLRHSLCHGWASGPAAYLMETVLGVSFREPGGKTVQVRPDLGDLAFAEGVCPLPGGAVLWVRAEKGEAGTRVFYHAPAGVRVMVRDAEAVEKTGPETSAILRP